VETRTIEQTTTVKASCAEVYDLLMDSARHQSLSGQKAVMSDIVGGAFTAWGSYISGFNLALAPGRKIVQAWRAAGWPADHYSIATFALRARDGGCELRFTQIGVPPDRYEAHCQGWVRAYWTPMREMLEDGRLSDETQAWVRAATARIAAGEA
jgi:activator of HSP90 ATPase